MPHVGFARSYPQGPLKKTNAPRFVLYRRVSTSEQGSSGLGLAAQLRDCELYLASQPEAEVVADFVEVTSGAKSERPQLKAALALCRQTGARLLVAKLDRLSRVVSEVALLMDDKTVDFVVARFPQASRFELHLYAALAEQERQFISQRTKAALAAAKARVLQLHNMLQILCKRSAQARPLSSGSTSTAIANPMCSSTTRLSTMVLRTPRMPRVPKHRRKR